MAGSLPCPISWCSKDPYIVDVSQTLDVVLEQMAEHNIDCAVVAKNDRVAGIFTHVDVCRRFVEWLKPCPPRLL
jgi:CBS domain-containing protein